MKAKAEAGLEIFKNRRDWTFAPTQSYGILGWFQHIIKGIALIVAILSWAEFLSFSPTSVEARGELETVRIIQLVVMGLLIVFYLVGALMRYISAEVFGFAFHIFHIVAHIVLLINLIYQYDPSAYVYIYGLLLLLGELLQIIYLFTRPDDNLIDVYDLPMNLVWGYSTALVLFYIILMVLQVIVSTVTYSQFHGF